ncbi:penicillin-binding protein activator [Pseudomonadales bacterium]|nr:penicillin-binding protein activator [Pseudomonadales bacterium]
MPAHDKRKHYCENIVPKMTLMRLLTSARSIASRLLSMACLMLLLFGCASGIKQPLLDSTSVFNERSSHDKLTLDEILERNRHLDLRNAPKIILAALTAAVKEQRWDIADNLFELIDPQQYQSDDLASYTLAVTQLLLHHKDYQAASAWLNSEQLTTAIPLMNTKDQVGLSIARADVLHALGHYPASAQERIFIESLLTDNKDISANAKAIWQTLLKMSVEQLQVEHSQSVDNAYTAWLELAVIHYSNQIDIAQQVKQVQDWRQRWPMHSAANHLPKSIEALKKSAATRPAKIVALLPLSGPLGEAGKAVQEGLATAYFTALNEGWQLPTITSYDTHQYSIEQLYAQAARDGADLIIGPLEKDKVAALLTMPTDIPILALNYISDLSKQAIESDAGAETNTEIGTGTGTEKNANNISKTILRTMPASLNIIQFGLAAEDEAQQLAKIARESNYRNAMIIQSSAGWSKRASRVFSEQWAASGGAIVSNTTLTEAKNYSVEIENSLLLPSSHARHERIENIIGQRIEFTPRRRNDIDVIVIFANSKQTRSIKPLLAYHYAGKLPVYSSSHINNGIEQSTKNRDLNGIIFNEIPWVLDSHSLKSQVAARYINNKKLGRLFAMGLDTFYLHPRIKQLQQAPDSQLQGMTGRLSLQNNRVVRELQMAKFVKGKAQKLALTQN